MIINSPANPRIAKIRKLARAKYRRKFGRFIVEGFVFIEEAFEEGLVREIYYSEEAAGSARLERWLKKLAQDKDRKANVYQVAGKIFRLLTQEENPAGVLALAAEPHHQLAKIKASQPEVILALADIRDPGNLGAILRTAENFGLGLVLAGRGCAELYNPKVVRSSAGAVWRLPVETEVDLMAELKKLKDKGYKIMAAVPDKGRNIAKVDWPKRSVIILGNEAAGVPGELEELADQKLSVPRLGRTESLNVAAAGAVILYEAARGKISDKI